MAKSFEEITAELNAKGFFWHQVSQLKDGKEWGVVVRKKGTWKTGYGKNKVLEKAVKLALADFKNQMTDKDWKKVLDKGVKSRKKRVKLRSPKRKR